MKTRNLCIFMLLCVITLSAMMGCSGKLETEIGIEQFNYPVTGKYGLNILAEDFVEAKIEAEQGRLIEYSVRAELSAGFSSLKIVIKSAKPILYVCSDATCGAKFDECHEITCPKCGRPLRKMGDRFIGLYHGSDFNWVISNADSQLTFTYVDELVHKSGKVADASVAFDDDCIIEYYENGAIEPTKVKEIKVIN